MTYHAPLDEMRFLLGPVLDARRLAATERFAEATPETVEAVLAEAARLAEDVLAPLRRTGDLAPARLENGVVRTPDGFAGAYRALAEGGWVGISADPAHGGMGLPLTVATCVGEMVAGANLALSVCPLLSQGQIEALEHHADAGLKALYLPKLASGEWTGTMNLTEPQAGTDVGAVRTRAEPDGAGTYAITGQKIYISWGDHDMAANVCHLVLARLPDAAPGTRGLSLFLVPKRIPDADGRPGVANGVRVISLEHKLGLHASPTCVMEFDGATGWLVGEAHGGMAAMFTMMNNARLGVGVQGIAVAEAATQAALDYARGRVQGAGAVGGRAGAARPCRRAADAPDHAGADRHGAGDRARLCAGDRHGARHGRGGLAGARGAADADRQGVRHGRGLRGRLARHPGPWRHGLHRGDRRRAILARRAGDRDLRGHERHPGDGSGRAQAGRRRCGGAGGDRRDRGDRGGDRR
jgi:acyl-CoA dehydrogenase